MSLFQLIVSLLPLTMPAVLKTVFQSKAKDLHCVCYKTVFTLRRAIRQLKVITGNYSGGNTGVRSGNLCDGEVL